MSSTTFLIVTLVILILAIAIFMIIKKSKRNNCVSFTSKNKAFSLSSVFKSGEINEDFFASLENTLISSDVGVNATKKIITKLRDEIDVKKINKSEEAKAILKEILLASFSDNTFFNIESKTILFVVGVNGVGKTTTIAKLANLIKKDKTVILAAADTFRAAAAEQLETWANKISVPIVKGQQAGDPSSILFSALEKAKNNNIDVVIVDTAGRFHNQENLVRQLEKMKKIATERFSDFKFVPILILDGNVGHNGLLQAKVFLDSLNVNGIVITKLDGSCKGGVAIAVAHELSIPILYNCYGEKIDDIKIFDKNEFINSILE